MSLAAITGGGGRQRHVRFSAMPYYRQVGEVPRKRHIRFERPGGGLHSEELMGVEGFSAESALLYHRQPPTAIVKAEAVDEAPAAVEVEPNRPLLPRHLRTHALAGGGDAVTGRQLLRRPGYDVDMEAILRSCAKHSVAIEINANPWRLDMDWRWCGRALELGCMFSINPDAHAVDEIDNMRWGILMARKGAVPRSRVINALNTKGFSDYLSARRQVTVRGRRPQRKAVGV